MTLLAAGLLAPAGCATSGGAVQEYDPQEIHLLTAGARAPDAVVQRAVAAAVDLGGPSGLVDDGGEFVVESVLVTPTLDEDCLVDPGEQPPADCPVVTGPLAEEWKESREHDAHGAQLVLRLDAPVAAPAALREDCPPLDEGFEVEQLTAHALVFAADPSSADRAYLFTVAGGGETVPCGPDPLPSPTERP